MNQIIALATELSGLGAEVLWAAALVFVRVGAALALLPAFGEQSVPARLRLVIALAFTAVVAPAVTSVAIKDGFVLPILIEVAAGLALGAVFRLFVLALQIAGVIIAQAISLTQLLAGQGEPQPAVSHLFTVAGLAFAVAAGLHVRAAEILILSYEFLPPGNLPSAGDFASWGLAQTVQAFSLAFTLAAPFTIASFLYNLALGVINRAMPALMVSFIGAPALSGGGLLFLAVLAPLVIAVWLRAFGGFMDAPFGAPP